MKFKRKRLIIVISIILFIVFIIFLSFFKKDKVEYVSVELKKQNLIQTVSEIGTVKANQELGLNFLQAGKLKSLNFKVGDQVNEGDVLAELDYSSLLIRKDEVLASLKIAQTNQDKLIKGASYEDIAVLEAQVRQSESSYESAKKDLEQVKKMSSENIYQAERNLSDLLLPNSQLKMSVKQSVESAKLALSNTEKTSKQIMENSRQSMLSSIDYNFSVARASLDSINRILNDEDIKNVFSVKNYFYKIESEKSYNQSMEFLPKIEAQIKIAKLDSNKENLKKTSDELVSFLNQVFLTLNNCFSALESTITSSSFSQASLDNFKNLVNTNKTNINRSLSDLQGTYFAFNNSVLSYETNVSSAQDNLGKAEAALSDAISAAENNLSIVKISSGQQILSSESRLDSAKKSYEVAKLQLSKLKTSASSNDLKLAQAQVDQANASLSLIEKQIEDNLIKAPINGKIVKMNYEVGEQVNNSKSVISLLTENNFEIEVLISESDISKIKIGNKAEISFDAFGDDYKIDAQVYFIEPAATSISDVIYYKTKLIFSEDQIDSNSFVIKSGMTANVNIVANFKKNVLTLPSRAILTNSDGLRYVRLLENNNIKEVLVEIGLSGDQTMTEVLSEDLKEGDLIVTSIRNKD